MMKAGMTLNEAIAWLDGLERGFSAQNATSIEAQALRVALATLKPKPRFTALALAPVADLAVLVALWVGVVVALGLGRYDYALGCIVTQAIYSMEVRMGGRLGVFVNTRPAREGSGPGSVE